MTRPGTAGRAPTSATVAVLCGLFILTASLLIVPMNLRDVSIMLNRGDFVRDEFEVDYFSQGRKRNTLGGHVVSTGETLSTSEENLIIAGGLARRRQLQEEKRLVGHRFPVWYLPAKGFWGLVDTLSRFRVISPDEFEHSNQSRVLWLGIGAAFYLTGALLVRWGVKKAKRAGARS